MKSNRRGLIWKIGAGVASFGLVRKVAQAQTPLSADDRLDIQELNARYFYAIDGLDILIPGDPAQNWANTFTSDGSFSIVQANGDPVLQIQGTKALIETFASFPDIATTRHWINDLLIEQTATGVTSGCYIIAMNIKNNPATIVRTGIYQDQLVKVSNQWKFQSRKLILDPNSPAG
ncbi:nuclear transport factor 2 family protein [Gloeocapsa sp. PCC 73106]|uniref:nuclear transport factor 2 family protein n=1 Tax=Gloeocapsa sp. PCC 73106 TaxID=102232 RepID=UPI0002ABD16E|nr:nuclear transport factor 2 family protein [Gloeocapsa sp. PCC 73106]ELR98754.1 hypothetical protein GLO73106DRAFT_00025920 [Gloeocapsa sp. PCC 73106]